jgi:hypothetical protein
MHVLDEGLSDMGVDLMCFAFLVEFCEHVRGGVEAIDVEAGEGEGDEEASGAAHGFEDGAVGLLEVGEEKVVGVLWGVGFIEFVILSAEAGVGVESILGMCVHGENDV